MTDGMSHAAYPVPLLVQSMISLNRARTSSKLLPVWVLIHDSNPSRQCVKTLARSERSTRSVSMVRYCTSIAAHPNDWSTEGMVLPCRRFEPARSAAFHPKSLKNSSPSYFVG